MNADQHHPDTPAAPEELTGNLKRAVDEVKGQQAPAESETGAIRWQPTHRRDPNAKESARPPR